MSAGASPGGAATPTLDALVRLGLDGVELRPGDHVCAFYRGAAGRDEILTPFIAEGLRSGEKCICFLELAERQAVVDRLRERLNAAGGRREGQLEVLDCTDTYLREGRFNQEEWFDELDRSMSTAIGGEGYAMARAAGEMGWALRTSAPGVDDFIDYEARVNWFAPRYPQILMCFYDLELFSGQVIVDVLKTHPRVLFNSRVVENPYYVSPEELLHQRS